MAAAQADPNMEQPGKPLIDVEALRRLGKTLSSRFTQYESDRRLAELKWARNARQYLGIYDPDVETSLDPNRSRAYPKVTRVKCVSMLSRLMNLLFPVDDRNWGVDASAVPNLPAGVLQPLLDRLAQTIVESGQPPDSAAVEQAIRDEAKKRAKRLEREIVDQLQDLGGTRAVDYVALCRKVLASGIQYGMGVLKGPFVEDQKQRAWVFDPLIRRFVVTETEAYRPRYEFVSIWDYYPDMSAKRIDQMDGQFQRYIFSGHQVSALKARPDFMKDQIDVFLQQSPTGNYKRRPYETELKAMGVQLNVAEAERGKYEAIVWEGNVSGRELRAAGAEVPEGKLSSDVRACVWLMGDVVVKAEIDPWSRLEPDDTMQMYHQFVFEEDESTLLGQGLPNIMRDSQMGICAATRMMIDNGSIDVNFEVNGALLSPNQDTTAIMPRKIWYREDDNLGTMSIPAVRAIEMPMHLAEYRGLVDLFQGFADQETFVNANTGGDMQKGPSEPFRTATGPSMIRGDAALPFKDVVRNFDVFTQSVISSLIVFNRNFNPNPDIQGDFQPVARGASSLIAKEVLGIQLDNLASTLTDEEKKYVNMRELARSRVRVRDLTVADLVFDDAKCDAIDAQVAQQVEQQQQGQQRMIEAQIREVLASTLKAISQAGKNSAAAEAATANVVLSALEKGLSLNDITHSGDGAGAEAGDPREPAGGGAGGDAQAAGAQAGEVQGAPAGMPAGGILADTGGSAGGGFAAPPLQ